MEHFEIHEHFKDNSSYPDKWLHRALRDCQDTTKVNDSSVS